MNRRRFLQTTATLTAGFWLGQGYAQGRKLSANDKLNIGIIGTANRARANIDGVKSQNIVAICDVDENYLTEAATMFPGAKKYADFRKLLEQKDIDAVVISTPDHTHAVATVAALQSGRHVYCEKPLTFTVSEARIVSETTRKTKLITQMGNQIHAGNNYRRVVELVQSGAIGAVREVHVFAGAGYGLDRSPKPGEVPSTLNYDLWLGPQKYRPYSPDYHPAAWRNWWAFGGGTMADFCCHHIDLSHWALDLRYPTAVEAKGPPLHPESVPTWMEVTYDYPARGEKPPVKLHWYQGTHRPPHFAQGILPKWGDGTLFIGEKGMLLASYSDHVLLPEKDFAGFKRPAEFIPNSIGHYEEWMNAIRTNGKTTCNFDYGAALTEAGLLGNVAFRVGKRIEWDTKKLKVTNAPEAEQYVQHDYRKGWKI